MPRGGLEAGHTPKNGESYHFRDLNSDFYEVILLMLTIKYKNVKRYKSVIPFIYPAKSGSEETSGQRILQ